MPAAPYRADVRRAGRQIVEGGMARILAAQFPDRGSAERALEALSVGGFDRQQMSLVSQEHELGAPPPPPRQQVTHSLAGSLVGSLIGGTAGALIAWLTSSLVHSVASTTTIGVIVCAIVGGAIGWFLGGLAGSGRPIEEGEYRQERVELGRMLLSVDPGTREAEARDIMQRFGGRDVRELGERGAPGSDRRSADGGSEESQHALT